MARAYDMSLRNEMRRPPEERFWAMVRIDFACWLFVGPRNPLGYGRFKVSGNRTVQAHRYVYELMHGPIPEGLELDHLCRVPNCVLHVEPVTRRENQLRGISFAGANARKTHCDHGHEFTEANTRRGRGRRDCRACKRRRNDARKWKREEVT